MQMLHKLKLLQVNHDFTGSEEACGLLSGLHFAMHSAQH